MLLAKLPEGLRAVNRREGARGRLPIQVASRSITRRSQEPGWFWLVLYNKGCVYTARSQEREREREFTRGRKVEGRLAVASHIAT